MIGIFYLISGVWEVCLGAVQGQYFSGYNPLLNFYRGYLNILGLITLIVGILLFCRINFVRIIAIILAWLNLFTVPIIYVWWYLYVIIIKKFLVANTSFLSYFSDFSLMLILSLIRIYIIRILSISRAGYIFIKRKDNEKYKKNF